MGESRVLNLVSVRHCKETQHWPPRGQQKLPARTPVVGLADPGVDDRDSLLEGGAGLGGLLEEQPGGDRSEKGVRLAQKMQVGPCIPVGIQP